MFPTSSPAPCASTRSRWPEGAVDEPFRLLRHALKQLPSDLEASLGEPTRAFLQATAPFVLG